MWVVVLNDGQTYSSLEGSKILFVPASEQGDDMDRYVKENEDKGIKLNITCGEYDLFSGDIIVPDLNEIEGSTTDVDMEENRYILCPSCQASVLPEQTIADGCGFCKD